jgi:hypothetical protein
MGGQKRAKCLENRQYPKIPEWKGANSLESLAIKGVQAIQKKAKRQEKARDPCKQGLSSLPKRPKKPRKRRPISETLANRAFQGMLEKGNYPKKGQTL